MPTTSEFSGRGELCPASESDLVGACVAGGKCEADPTTHDNPTWSWPVASYVRSCNMRCVRDLGWFDILEHQIESIAQSAGIFRVVGTLALRSKSDVWSCGPSEEPELQSSAGGRCPSQLASLWGSVSGSLIAPGRTLAGQSWLGVLLCMSFHRGLVPRAAGSLDSADVESSSTWETSTLYIRIRGNADSQKVCNSH